MTGNITKNVEFGVISQLYMSNLGMILRQYACYLLLHQVSGDSGGYKQAICWPFAAYLPSIGNLHFFMGHYTRYISTVP